MKTMLQRILFQQQFKTIFYPLRQHSEESLKQTAIFSLYAQTFISSSYLKVSRFEPQLSLLTSILALQLSKNHRIFKQLGMAIYLQTLSISQHMFSIGKVCNRSFKKLKSHHRSGKIKGQVILASQRKSDLIQRIIYLKKDYEQTSLFQVLNIFKATMLPHLRLPFYIFEIHSENNQQNIPFPYFYVQHKHQVIVPLNHSNFIMMKPLSKKAGVMPSLKEKLKDSIASLRQLSAERNSELSYVQTQFILNHKRISQNAINTFLKQLYHDRFQEINNQWQSQLKDEKILEDIFSIKRKAIEQQWITENMNNHRIKEKQYKFKEYISNLKDKTEMQHRIKVLKDQLYMYENQISKAKKQDQIVLLRDKYDKAKQEYTFLTNKNRRMNKLEEQKSSIEYDQQGRTKIQEIQKEIQEKSLERERKRYVDMLINNPCSNKFKKIIKHQQSGQQRISQLQQIFKLFSKKEGKDKMLFGQISSSQKYVSLNHFLHMLAVTQLNSLLTVEQRMLIFKQNSKYSKQINFTSFVAALNAICHKNCQKLNITFDSHILDAFLDDFVSKIQSNYSHSQLSLDFLPAHKKTEDLKSNHLPKYKFKVAIHSGKFQENIKEELLQRKQSKKQRLADIKEKSYTIDYSSKNNRVKSRESRQSVETKHILPLQNEIKRKMITSPSSGEDKSQPNKTISKESYASIFQRRQVIGQLSKRYSTETYSPIKEFKKSDKKFSEKLKIAQPQSNLQQDSSKKQTTPSNFYKQQNQQLKELIGYEEDPFLTSHLNKKALLISNDYSSRKTKKIHF